MDLVYKRFIERSHIDSDLIEAVIQQYGSFEDFYDQCKSDGYIDASSGVPGFIYYSETIEFSKRHFSEIYNSLQEQADELGYSSCAELLSGFKCLEGVSTREIEWALVDPEMSDYESKVYTALAWYALEEVANSLINTVIEV